MSLGQPLLGTRSPRPTEDVQLERKYPIDKPEKGADLTTTCINLMKNMVGAGLLNVCVAFKYSSVLGGLLDMILSSFLCTCGFLLIGYCCSKTGARSFRVLMCISMGDNKWGKIIDIILFFHTLFSCVGYITLIGDFTTKSMSGLSPTSIFATNRTFATLAIVVTILFPLSLLRDLAPLKMSSAFGLIAIAFSCAYVTWECIFYTDPENPEHTPMQTLSDNMWYVKFDHFKTIALFNGSFSAHYNAPTFYAELKHKSFKRYAIAALISFGIATAVFTLFGLVGFARWGHDVLGNVLKAYNPDSFFVQVSWMCMNFATIAVFPLAFQRMRASWTALFNKPFHITSGSNVPWTTIILLGVATYFGIAFTDIAVVKMIKGATLGVSIMFIFPALAYLGISGKKDFEVIGGDVDLLRQISTTQEVMQREPVVLLRLFSYSLIFVGIFQGMFALLSHYKIIT